MLLQPFLIYTHVPCNSNDHHKSICACGFETTSPHVVTSTSGRIGTCKICGASVTIGSGTIMPWGDNGGISETYATNNGIRQTSANGSFILPNGVIVLVDKDVEAYFKGELEFFDLKNNSTVY